VFAEPSLLASKFWLSADMPHYVSNCVPRRYLSCCATV
jgi:hypothetical protein